MIRIYLGNLGNNFITYYICIQVCKVLNFKILKFLYKLGSVKNKENINNHEIKAIVSVSSFFMIED